MVWVSENLKTNKEINMRRLVYVLCGLVLMVVAGCEADREKCEVSISSETTVFGITFKVSPTYLKDRVTV